MRDILIILGTVASAITAITMFALASDNVTKRQNAIVTAWLQTHPGGTPDLGAALAQAEDEKKQKRRIFVALPALAAVGLNIAALTVAPAEPHCGDKPTQHSSPADPSRTTP